MKVTITREKSADTVFPGMLWLSRAIQFRGILPQTTQPQADFEENIVHTQAGSTLANAWPTLFISAMIMNNKERQKLPQTRGDLMTKYSVVS